MAYDKIVDSAVLDAGLTSVADAIRQKGGTSASLSFPQGFVDAIGEISGGGEDTISALLDNALTELEPYREILREIRQPSQAYRCPM